jgi:hypothetical protein
MKQMMSAPTDGSVAVWVRHFLEAAKNCIYRAE